MGYEVSFIGLLVSLLFIGLTGYYPGGIIVPSYLVLFVDQPARIAGTLAISLLTVFCYKLASHYVILFGKRRFIFIILVGALWTFFWLQILPYFFPSSLEFRMIGWVIPGLIANQFERQGILVTTASLIVVIVFVYFLGKMFYIVKI
ncbi:MAG: poly-gamma-glutamate biosynthesis protein PgsC [bacterium]|nr:poly-gamma-glutamate biosynthesis protein PgsC [bacterium]